MISQQNPLPAALSTQRQRSREDCDEGRLWIGNPRLAAPDVCFCMCVCLYIYIYWIWMYDIYIYIYIYIYICNTKKEDIK